MKRSLGWMMIMAVAAAASVAAGGSGAQEIVLGESISIAFGRDEPPTTPGCQLAATDSAGVLPFRSAHWNNTVGNTGTEGNLVRDRYGVASSTSASVSWTADNTWSTEPGGTRGQFTNCFEGTDEILMTGYLDNANANPTVISVENLPADMAEGYTVVIYSLGGGGGGAMAFFVNDPARANPKYLVQETTLYRHRYLGPNYVQARGNDPQLGATGSTDDFGNYVVFSHVSGNLTIVAEPLPFGDYYRAPVNAIQIFKE